jgi:hypothetical protein
MLEFLSGRASERKLRLFACAGWRWRYTRSAPKLLRWTLFRLLLAPLGKAEGAADRAEGPPAPRWWGAFTFGAPEAMDAALGTAGTFRDAFLGLFDPSAEAAALCRLLREVFGNPFRAVGLRPAWLTWSRGTVRRLAEAAYEERSLPECTLDPTRLGVLTDALEEAGCADADLLGHLRGPGPHVRGCWALDLLLDKG